MNSNLICECGREISEFECNTCRTKKLAFLLMKGGVDVSLVSHVIRDIKKKIDSDFIPGEIICHACNENLVSQCPQCFASNIRNIIYFHFPNEISKKLFYLSQNI